jgi:hypothetical protein
MLNAFLYDELIFKNIIEVLFEFHVKLNLYLTDTNQHELLSSTCNVDPQYQV